MSDSADNTHPPQHLSREESAAFAAFYAPAESLILPNGAVGEESAELLEEFVGTHQHHTDEVPGVLVDEGEEIEIERRKTLPWWRRPSPWWILCAVPFSAVAKSATVAPKVEVYTMLACRVHKPDIFHSMAGHDAVLMPNLLRSEHAYSAIPWASNMVSQSNSSSQASTLFVQVEKRDRKPANPCAADPVVQAAVARLSAVMETLTGVLSLLTTGWWGAFADRQGRAKILSITLVGLLISDFNFINVYSFSESLPGNYWFLLIGAILEGLLGGFATAVAATHAYIAETSTDATRARFLSLNLGFLFTGMALGPSLGSLLIRAMGRTISVFYFATLVHVLYAFLIFFGLPEPLTKHRMKMSKLKYEEELRAGAEERNLAGMAGLQSKARRLFQFLSPLSIFMPDFDADSGRNPLKRQHKDWSLSLIAVAYGFTISILASFPYIFQYANATFGWSSETLGYWLSVVGAGRAIWLTVCLPIAIKLLKPKPMILEIPVAPTSSLAPEEEHLLSSDQDAPQPRKTIRKELHSPHFELGVARVSLVLDIVAYGVVALFTSQKAFGLFGVLGAMGIGYSPAVQTLALALYARRGGTETGRLFGALSVVQALSAQILGPSIYGFIYIRTVATFPRAIFFAGMACVTVSLILMSFIRLPQDKELRKEIMGMYRRGDSEDEESPVSEASPTRR